MDVHYEQRRATAACILFRDWSDEYPLLELTEVLPEAQAYEPGRFYLRELPGLLSVIGKLPQSPEVIIIDAYVWLGDESHPGLGARLFEALGATAAVIGVAKTVFRKGPAVRAVRRGASARPLYVTAVGMDVNEAAERIVQLHGKFRIPTLIKKVDRLCRRSPRFG